MGRPRRVLPDAAIFVARAPLYRFGESRDPDPNPNPNPNPGGVLNCHRYSIVYHSTLTENMTPIRILKPISNGVYISGQTGIYHSLFVYLLYWMQPFLIYKDIVLYFVVEYRIRYVLH